MENGLYGTNFLTGIGAVTAGAAATASVAAEGSSAIAAAAAIQGTMTGPDTFWWFHVAGFGHLTLHRASARCVVRQVILRQQDFGTS